MNNKFSLISLHFTSSIWRSIIVGWLMSKLTNTVKTLISDCPIWWNKTALDQIQESNLIRIMIQKSLFEISIGFISSNRLNSFMANFTIIIIRIKLDSLIWSKAVSRTVSTQFPRLLQFCYVLFWIFDLWIIAFASVKLLFIKFIGQNRQLCL